jgi:hypothetical protein
VKPEPKISNLYIPVYTTKADNSLNPSVARDSLEDVKRLSSNATHVIKLTLTDGVLSSQLIPLKDGAG